MVTIPHPTPVYDDALEADLEDYISGCNGCPECRLVCPQSKVEALIESQTFAEDEHIPGSFNIRADAATGQGFTCLRPWPSAKNTLVQESMPRTKTQICKVAEPVTILLDRRNGGGAEADIG